MCVHGGMTAFVGLFTNFEVSPWQLSTKWTSLHSDDGSYLCAWTVRR